MPPQAKKLPEAKTEAGIDPSKNLQGERGPADPWIEDC